MRIRLLSFYAGSTYPTLNSPQRRRPIVGDPEAAKQRRISGTPTPILGNYLLDSTKRQAENGGVA